MENIKYKFKNGVEFNGTAQQILDYAKLLGESIDASRFETSLPRGYYLSATNGPVKISDMETSHIVNSLNKITVDYYLSLKPSKSFNLSEYLTKFVGLTNNPQVEDLYTELTKRK